MHATDLAASGEKEGALGESPCHNIVTIETNKSAAIFVCVRVTTDTSEVHH